MPVSSTTNPVTVTAEVAVNIDCNQLVSSYEATGSFSNTVPIAMSSAKPRNKTAGGLRLSKFFYYGDMFIRKYMRIPRFHYRYSFGAIEARASNEPDSTKESFNSSIKFDPIDFIISLFLRTNNGSIGSRTSSNKSLIEVL